MKGVVYFFMFLLVLSSVYAADGKGILNYSVLEVWIGDGSIKFSGESLPTFSITLLHIVLFVAIVIMIIYFVHLLDSKK